MAPFGLIARGLDVVWHVLRELWADLKLPKPGPPPLTAYVGAATSKPMEPYQFVNPRPGELLLLPPEHSWCSLGPLGPVDVETGGALRTRDDDGTSLTEQWILDHRNLTYSEYLDLPVRGT